jgi:methyl-accepting chemotaxis protein
MFKNLTVGKKIALGFFLITVLGIVVGGIGLYSARTITSQGQIAIAADVLLSNLQDCRRQEKNFLIRKWKKAEGDTKNSEEKLKDNIATSFDSADVLASMLSGRDLARLEKGKAGIKEYEKSCNDFIQAQRDMDAALLKARETAQKAQTLAYDKIRQPAKDLIAEGKAGMDRSLVMVDASNGILEYILQSRRDEKQFIIEGTDAIYTRWQESMVALEGDKAIGLLAQAKDPQILEMVSKARPLLDQYCSAAAALKTANLSDAAARNADSNVEKMRNLARGIETIANQARQRAKDLYQAALDNGIRLADIGDTANRIVRLCVVCRQHEKQYVIDQTHWDKWEETVKELEGDTCVAHLEKIAKDPRIVAGLNEAVAAFTEYQKACNEYKTAKLEQVSVENDLVAQARTVTAVCTELSETAQSDMVSQSSSSITIIITSLVVCVVLAVVLAVLIGRAITGALKRIIDSLSEGAEQVSSASGQVSSASQSLAEGSTEQAAGLEETSSSLEEMASMTKQNADNAQQANTLSSETRKAADTGTESMNRMNSAIQEIQKSSDETAKIIKVIDEIAFQTNLLALNAAVEAARAGEAGKGFAVVAEEVRNLAMRSAEAAKNTSAMIEESVKNSKNGVDIAGEVSKVLDEIVQSIGKTTDLVGEIAAASQEQSQGIDQVNTAVAQMDKVTQQNAANAEESASASEQLNAQAESMNDVVGELIALVGGASSKGTKSGQNTSRRHLNINVDHGAAQKTHELLAKHHGPGQSDNAFHQIAGGNKKKKEGATTATTKATAAKAIPLDDDNSGSDDLKEFNS